MEWSAEQWADFNDELGQLVDKARSQPRGGHGRGGPREKVEAAVSHMNNARSVIRALVALLVVNEFEARRLDAPRVDVRSAAGHL